MSEASLTTLVAMPAPPGRLREFWGYFSANHGAVAGIVIVAILGPGIMNAMLAVAVVVLPHYVRITRAAVISETSKDYVTAARTNGAGLFRLMFKEVLPNCSAPLIVQASLGVSTAILD